MKPEINPRRPREPRMWLPYIMLAVMVLTTVAVAFYVHARHQEAIASGDWDAPFIAFAGLLFGFVLFFVTRAQVRARAEAEAAAADFRASENRFRTVIEQSPISTQILSPDGRTLRVNRAWEELWGVTLEVLGGYNILEDPQLEEKGIAEYIRRGFAGEATAIPPILYDPEKSIPGLSHHEDPRRWVSAVIYPVRDEEGRIREIVLMHEDITERMRAEGALREQTEVVKTVNRVGQLLTSELDQERLVQAVTDAATELTGAHYGSFFYNVTDERGDSYTLYTMSGVPRAAFAHFPMPRATDLFGPTFRGEGTVRIDDVKQDPRYGKNSPYFGMPAGHLPIVSYLAVPVISRSGDVLGGLFFAHQEVGVFTERHGRLVEGLAAQAAVAMDNARLFEAAQRARLQAEDASRLKDEFLATLSHELRTPLTSVLGWSKLLRSEKFDPAMIERGLEAIERNAVAQTRLINDLLDVSSIITGKLRLDTHPVVMAAVVEAAVESSRPAAAARGVRLDVQLDGEAGPVAGDADRLQQVVWNILSNAIKFTPRGGSVHVRLAQRDGYAEVTITDTGRGIAPEFLPYVFERFRQADGRITREHGGLGLGLSIARHLVELHGGNISAASPGEGRGATFSFGLPLLQSGNENL
jgi:PAS domain S-box-containing protein